MVSGDADIRVGVELAQKFGARVHLVEITRIGQHNLSIALQEEADTVTDWTKEDIQKFLSVNRPVTLSVQGLSDGLSTSKVVEAEAVPSVFSLVVDEVLNATSPEDLVAISGDLHSTPNFIPPMYDGRLLSGCRNRLSRDLEQSEKTKVRNLFRQAVRERSKRLVTVGDLH